jgi:hypothetical protein
MEFHYDDYYRPSNDVVFAICFANKALFIRLCSAVYGQSVTIVGEPHSQATVREDDALLNAIRFDVLGIADTEQIFTIDIQRRYSSGRQERRGAYYMCRAVSSQRVVEMKYEELHPVHIAFILTEGKGAGKGVRRVGLCYLDNGEPYDDLIELVLVYVPTVIREADESVDSDLYVFSRFFAVSSTEDAAAYAAEFEANDLGRELISVYNTIVANYQELQDIENSPYFTQRLTEAQLAKARAEAEAKGEARGVAIGEARGEARGKSEGINRLAGLIRKGYDLDAALKIIEEGVYIDEPCCR